MLKKRNCAMFFACFVFCVSCQEDNYEEPKIVPISYSFNIPNKVSFNFYQQSQNRESIVPYSNTLILKNISNDSLSMDYVLLAFKNDLLNYTNLKFIKQDRVNINSGIATDSITLETSNTLFSDQNLISAILKFNDSINDHKFNGLYNGELNIFTSTETDTIFQRSITCVGIIDHQGKFDFFIEDEDNIARLKGNFNSSNLISGDILDRDASNISSILNIEENITVFDSLNINLKGNIKFTENAQERILKFNLTKQN